MPLARAPFLFNAQIFAADYRCYIVALHFFRLVYKFSSLSSEEIRVVVATKKFVSVAALGEGSG